MKNNKAILTARIMTEQRAINNVNSKNRRQVLDTMVGRSEELTSAVDIIELWTSIISRGNATHCLKGTPSLTSQNTTAPHS